MPTGKEAGYLDGYVTALLVHDTRQVHMCLKKNTYHSVPVAERTIEYRKSESSKALRWYVCPYCGWYHITSHDKAETPMAA